MKICSARSVACRAVAFGVGGSILSLSIFAAGSVYAQQTPQSLADAELPSLLTIYKDIHSHPELSGREERTSTIVAKELHATGCEVTEHLGKYAQPEF